MDGHDRKKLPAADLSRQEHLNKYGSFLYCPKRDTLCDHMNGMWSTGCRLARCILDDPEYQRLQDRIEKNRQKNAQEHRQEKKAEKNDPAAPIRNQSKAEDRLRDQIEQVEEQARQAWSRGRSNEAMTLENRAAIMRGRLK